MSIELGRWGKDHWSTFAYIEHLCVESLDNIGRPQLNRIQANANRHPGLVVQSLHGTLLDGSNYGIRLAGGDELPGPDYDEWDCIDDMEREGLLEQVGTGIHPEFKLTEHGRKVAGLLRSHKSRGKSFGTFRMISAKEMA